MLTSVGVFLRDDAYESLADAVQAR